MYIFEPVRLKRIFVFTSRTFSENKEGRGTFSFGHEKELPLSQQPFSLTVSDIPPSTGWLR